MLEQMLLPEPQILRTVQPRRVIDLDSYVVVDLETTGLRLAKDRIIEIGSVRVEHGQIVNTFQQLVRLDDSLVIPAFVCALTGITMEMLEQQGHPLEEALGAWRQFAGDLPLVAHNATCDYRFLGKALATCNELRAARQEEQWGHISYLVFDTLAMARKLYPGWKHNLGELARQLSIDCRGTHRALQDCLLTHELLQTMMRHPEWPKWYFQRVGWLKKALKLYKLELGIARLYLGATPVAAVSNPKV